MGVEISVVIPTFNGSRTISRCLECLSHQSGFSVGEMEVLIVDNGSSDATADVARTSWAQLGVPFSLRVLSERKTGAQHARITGARNALGRFVLFCDDDNLLEVDYAATALKSLEKHPDVGLIGGYGVSETDAQVALPEWFEPVAIYFAAEGSPKTYANPILRVPVMYSAGMAARREIFQRLDEIGFCPLLNGRTGHSLVGGEDVEICKAIRMLGWELARNCQMSFGHILPAHRVTKSYVRRMAFAMGTARAIHRAYDYYLPGGPTSVDGDFLWFREVRRMTKRTIKSLGRVALYANSRAEATVEDIVQLGYYTALLRIRSDFDRNVRHVGALKARIGAMTTAES